MSSPSIQRGIVIRTDARCLSDNEAGAASFTLAEQLRNPTIQSASGLVLSGLIHGFAAIVLALFIIPGDLFYPPDLTLWAQRVETPEEITPFTPEPKPALIVETAGAQAREPVFEPPVVSTPLGDGSLEPNVVGPWSGEAGSGGDGKGKVGAGKQKATFFGAEISGQSVVFVVDMSGSMTGIRFARAQQQLIKAIQGLDASQEFSVVLFNDYYFPIFYPRPTLQLLSATQLNKRRAQSWILAREPCRNTDPEEALKFALGLHPEVIYFLTDGEFPEECRDAAKEFNTRKSIIHTIAFQSYAGGALLKQIAADHGGTYRFMK